MFNPTQYQATPAAALLVRMRMLCFLLGKMLQLSGLRSVVLSVVSFPGLLPVLVLYLPWLVPALVLSPGQGRSCQVACQL